MVLLQARLNALRKEKDKNLKETQWARSKIDFITTIRNRCDDDDRRKREEKQRKDLEGAYLKRKADEYRETSRNTREWTFSTLSSRKAEEGKTVRELSRVNDSECQLFKQREEEQNRSRAEEVKSMERDIEQELR